MGKALQCPKCGEDMQYQIEHGFWKCPICAGEFWPDEETEEKQIMECFYDTVIIPYKKSSGGKRRRPARGWVPLPSERWMLV